MTAFAGIPREYTEGVLAPVVAHPQAQAEDEGWLVSYVYDPARDASDLIVDDASNFSGPPQAVIALPQRVPLGFHGCWIPMWDGRLA
jgi:carotenoid cleavage dioxygenase